MNGLLDQVLQAHGGTEDHPPLHLSRIAGQLLEIG
jgi:hypothetical protein